MQNLCGCTLDGAPLSDAANPATNVFNSTVSAADRVPGYVNTLGWDVDVFPTVNVLGNDRRTATVELATTLDTYAPGVVTIATDLYAPKLEVTITGKPGPSVIALVSTASRRRSASRSAPAMSVWGSRMANSSPP